MKAEFCILLAEDDTNDAFFLTRAFREAKIDSLVRVTRDGQEALDYLAGLGGFADRKEFPLPCLVILDLKMPRKTGLDVLAWLRKQPVLKSVPAIVFSSSDHRYDVERAYQWGANAFIVKPSSVQKRLELARLIKGFWIDFNQPPMLCVEGPEVAREIHSASEAVPTLTY